MLCAENKKLFKCFHICILRAHLNESTHVQRCKCEYLDMLNPNIMCFCKKHQFLRKPHDCSYIMREAMWTQLSCEHAFDHYPEAVVDKFWNLHFTLGDIYVLTEIMWITNVICFLLQTT